MTVTPRPRSARPVMLAERSAGPRSTTQRVRGPTASVSSRGQSTVSTQIAWARCSVRPASRPQATAQSRAIATAGARAGWWKPRATGMDSTVGAKARPPRVLASISAASAAARFSMAVRSRRSASGVPLTTTRRGPLTAATVATSPSVGDPRPARGPRRAGAADGEHRGVLAVRHQAGAAADDRGGRADQAGDRHQLDVAVVPRDALPAAGERGDAEDALASGRPRRPGRSVEVEALGGEQVEGGELGEQHAGHAQRRHGECRRRPGACLGGEPRLRLERPRQGARRAGRPRGRAGADSSTRWRHAGRCRVLLERARRGSRTSRRPGRRR